MNQQFTPRDSTDIFQLGWLGVRSQGYGQCMNVQKICKHGSANAKQWSDYVHQNATEALSI